MLYNLSLRKDGLFSGNTTAPTLELYALRKNGSFTAPFLVLPDGTIVLAGAQNAVNGNVGIGVRDTKGYKLAIGGSMVAEKVVVKHRLNGLILCLSRIINFRLCTSWKPM